MTHRDDRAAVWRELSTSVEVRGLDVARQAGLAAPQSQAGLPAVEPHWATPIELQHLALIVLIAVAVRHQGISQGMADSVALRGAVQAVEPPWVIAAALHGLTQPLLAVRAVDGAAFDEHGPTEAAV